MEIKTEINIIKLSELSSGSITLVYPSQVEQTRAFSWRLEGKKSGMHKLYVNRLSSVVPRKNLAAVSDRRLKIFFFTNVSSLVTVELTVALTDLS